MDKGLLKLSEVQVGQIPNPYQEYLKSIELSIGTEIEVEIQIDSKPLEKLAQAHYDEDAVAEVLQQVAFLAFHNNLADLFSYNKATQVQHILDSEPIKDKLMPEFARILNTAGTSRELEERMDRFRRDNTSRMIELVASLKGVLGRKTSIKNVVVSALLDICKIFLQPKLLRYLLFRFIPFMHSLKNSYFDSTLFYILGETLNYILLQINNLDNLRFEERVSSSDLFAVRSSSFGVLVPQECQGFSSKFMHYFRLLKRRHDRILNPSYTSMLLSHVGFYEYRTYALGKLHFILMSFLSKNMQLHLAKNLKATVIANILYLNFTINKRMVEILPLDNICVALKVWLEILQVLREFANRFKRNLDGKRQDYLYYRALKFGLNHFSKNATFFRDSFLTHSSNIKKLRKKYYLYLSTCKYLESDKYHGGDPLQSKKRQKKVYKGSSEDNLSFIVKRGSKPTFFKKIEATVGFRNQSIYSLTYAHSHQQQERTANVRVMRRTLILLIGAEIDRLSACAYKEFGALQNPYSLVGKKLSLRKAREMFGEINSNNLYLTFYIVFTFGPFIKDRAVVERLFADVLTANYKLYMGCGHFLDIFINHNLARPDLLKDILYWRSPHIQIMLKYLSRQYETQPFIQLFFTKTMKRLYSDQLIFYLPQIYLALGEKSGQIIYQFFIDYSQRSVLFAHQLIWMTKVEQKNDEAIPQPNIQRIEKISYVLQEKLVRNMDPERKAFFFAEDSFLEQVTAISGILKPQMPKPEKREIIAAELAKILVTPDIYLPSNPKFQVVQIKLDSGTPMQSAAKCPILVSFYCKKYEGPDKYFERKVKDAFLQPFDEPDEGNVVSEVDDSERDIRINYMHPPMQVKGFPREITDSGGRINVVDLKGRINVVDLKGGINMVESKGGN